MKNETPLFWRIWPYLGIPYYSLLAIAIGNLTVKAIIALIGLFV